MTQRLEQLKVGAILSAGTVLRGTTQDNHGLVIELLEDLEVAEKIDQIISSKIRIHETGEGNSSIYLEAYRGNRSTVKTIVDNLKGDYEIDATALFYLRFFQPIPEDNPQQKLADNFEKFLLQVFEDGRDINDEDSVLRIITFFTIASEFAKHDIGFDFSDLSVKHEFAREDLNKDLSFIIRDSSYGTQCPDKAIHFERIFKYLGESSSEQANFLTITRASEAIHHFSIDSELSREVLVKTLNNYIQDSNKKNDFLANSELLNDIIALFATNETFVRNIYDPCLGTGNTLISTINQIPNKSHVNIFGQDINRLTFLYAGLQFILLGIPVGNLRNRDSLNKSKTEQFDLICTVPPYGKDTYSFGFGKVTYEEAFLIHCTENLSIIGQALIIVPTKFLTHRSSVKKHLLQENKIDAIIELPAIDKSRTPLPLSLIILKNNRNTTTIFLANLAEYQFKIGSASREYLIFIEALNSTKRAYEAGLPDSVFHYFADKDEFRGASLNLKPSTYAFEGKEELEYFLSSPIGVKLADITLYHFSAGKITRKKVDIALPGRIINTRDLRQVKDHLYFSGPLSDSQVYPLRQERILEDGDILIPLHDITNAKIFRQGKSKTKYSVSPNLMALRVDKTKIIPAYLVKQLSRPLVVTQAKMRQTGVTILRLSSRNLLEIVISLPSIENQLAQLDKNKETDVSIQDSWLNKVEEASSNYFIKDDTPVVVKALKHYVSNRYQGVRVSMDLLQEFLQNQPHFSESSVSDNSDMSVSDIVQKLARFQQDIFDVTNNIEGLFQLDKKLETKTGDIRKALQTASHIYQDEFTVRVKGDSAIMAFNPFCLKVIAENLLSNFAKHGGIHEIENPTAEFTVYRPSGDIVEIIYQNNGRPFPKELSFEDYLSADQRAGEFAGAGLGGSLILKAVEKLNGTIHPITVHGVKPEGWNVILVITLKRI